MPAKPISISKLKDSCEDVSALLRALSHPGRLLVLDHLLQGEKTVSELQELCGISQSQLSQFLGRMKLEGLVACEKKGRFCYYRTASPKVSRLITAINSIYCK
ncbi:MAG TPA: metalloregulator ArsR/SmtB family transcription factor [Bdellovibrionales bacterium]|nr:metalloregulator ArsR/SmtB family transcription factor [Bdellovibrionales bacterium]